MVCDINSIDIIGVRNDWEIDLFIDFLGKLEDSVEQQTLLLDKIENYLVYLNSTCYCGVNAFFFDNFKVCSWLLISVYFFEYYIAFLLSYIEKSTQLVQEIVKSKILNLIQFFQWKDIIHIRRSLFA